MPLDNNIKFKRVHRDRPLILVTNDDGIHSNGLKELSDSLKRVGEVLVVAPLTEQSGTSHSFTLHRPLRCNKVKDNTFVVDGTPTDCVNLAINFILRDSPPDIIFSGINSGPNLGDDLHYSGTVSAAVEGGIMGIPSVAMSVADIHANVPRGVNSLDYSAAAAFAAKLAKKILKEGLPRGVILNVNAPSAKASQVRNYKITFQGKKNYSNITTEKIDPRGHKYYWICGEEVGFENIEGSDCYVISKGEVSITPIKVDLTDYEFLNKIQGWKI